MLCIFPGIIVAGGPGSGKTSCITSLVETLARWSLVTHGNTGAQVHAHKLQRINPLAVSDLSLMFGHLGPNGDWLDGIFTSYWRKANKEHNVHRTTTWLCLDAPLHQGWAENLSSVLDDGKVMGRSLVAFILEGGGVRGKGNTECWNGEM